MVDIQYIKLTTCTGGNVRNDNLDVDLTRRGEVSGINPILVEHWISTLRHRYEMRWLIKF